MTQQSRLRTLARAYSEGKIDKDKYRSDRGTFFTELVAGNVALPAEDDIAKRLVDGDTFSDITLQKIGETIAESSTAKEPHSIGLLNNKPVIFGGIGAVVIIIILVAVFSGGDDDAPIQQIPSQENVSSAPAVADDAPPSPLVNHISSFLSANLWSEASLNAFLIEWQSFSDIDRASAMNTTEFSRLINEISKKLLEERALAAIGNPETSYEKQRQLVEFADAIGIRDQRISLPDAP